MISYWVELSFRVKNWKFGRISMMLANFSLLSLLVLRWKESGHFPLSNLYESFMFLAWSFSTFHFVLEMLETGPKNGEPQAFFTGNGEKQSFVGAFTAPTALFMTAFATFRLPPEMQESSPLVPALQSNWLMMHVTVMILSYAALICGSLLSIAFLIVTKNLPVEFKSPNTSNASNIESKAGQLSPQTATNANFQTAVYNVQLDPASPNIGAAQLKGATMLSNEHNEMEEPNVGSYGTNVRNSENQAKTKFAETLDNLSYRMLGIGFPLLTIGILSGAVWANEAWGSYWSWDPKETWALATWFVFAIYLHTRLTKGWRGKKPAILASVGFVTVWVCFLGVNLLGEGLHSYGFLKDAL